MGVVNAPIYSDFNSHTREGVTSLQYYVCCTKHNFNSHTREGVTRSRYMPSGTKRHFNSHTREGVTSSPEKRVKNQPISTHTPVRV